MIQVTNVGTVPATQVTITDDLVNMTYVANSATLNGLPTGVTYSAPTFTVDYYTPYGPLQPAETAVFRTAVGGEVVRPTHEQVDLAIAIVEAHRATCGGIRRRAGSRRRRRRGPWRR